MRAESLSLIAMRPPTKSVHRLRSVGVKLRLTYVYTLHLNFPGRTKTLIALHYFIIFKEKTDGF